MSHTFQLSRVHAVQGLGWLQYGSFRKLGVPHLGALIIKILLFRVLYWGPVFSETPIWALIIAYTILVHSIIYTKTLS